MASTPFCTRASRMRRRRRSRTARVPRTRRSTSACSTWRSPMPRRSANTSSSSSRKRLACQRWRISAGI
eukprot:7698647-Pyramimonas_sp.AAC.1